MPKFTFICEHTNFKTDEVDIKNISEFKGETLHEVIENFELFLKGSGYIFDGQLDFVNQEDETFTIQGVEGGAINDTYFPDDNFDFEVGPTLTVSIDDELKVDSAAWPFPANERP